MAIKRKRPQWPDKLTQPIRSEAGFFVQLANSKHRQYEALRAYFVENVPGKEVAEAFGYTPGAFYMLCHQFRSDPQPEFFIQTRPGPKHGRKRDQATKRIVQLRKNNYSVPDIQLLLQDEGIGLSTVWIWRILKEQGFSKLPRRRDEERPSFPRPEKAEYADVRGLCLDPRMIETRVGGIFLLMRILSDMNIHTIPVSLGWYGSKMIPTPNAFLSCLLLKLIGKERKSHVMDFVFDKGLALAVGLNVLPKTAYVSEYSERITHQDNIRFLHKWLRKLRKANALTGESFNLDFQSLPYFGEEQSVEKHYVSMRSRSQKAVLVFFAQDAESKIFCYSNADLRKGEEAEEIFRFIAFWKKQTGRKPPHLVFDSKLTTHANLSKLNRMGITFITLRRRTPKVLQDVVNAPASAWRKIELSNVKRKYRTPKVIDKQVHISDYLGPIRQVFVKDLGHDLPTILLTNDKRTSCTHLIGRYALRMLIENSIANGVAFFHNTALSSSIAMRTDFDVLLTLIGQASYYLLARKLRGYERCRASVIFRKFIDTPGKIFIDEKEIEVRLNKRAHNPILLHSGLVNTPFKLPWLRNKSIVITLS